MTSRAFAHTVFLARSTVKTASGNHPHVNCYFFHLLNFDSLPNDIAGSLGRKSLSHTLQFLHQCLNLAQRGIGLLLVDLGTDIAYIFYLPIIADVTELCDSTIINVWRIG